MSLAGQVSLLATRAGAECKALWAAVSGKEPAVAAGTAGQYWRGDKTWQTLDDSHTHDARYFTEAESDARFVNLIETGVSTFKRARGVLKWSQTGTAIAGELVIQTNMTFGNFMARLHIQGFNYVNGSNILDLKVAFYANTGPAFAQHNAQSDGTMPIAQVRLMRRTADDLVAIVITSGNASNLWYYPKIAVDAIVGHTGIADSMLQGWTATITSDLSAYTAMVTPAIELGQAAQDELNVRPKLVEYTTVVPTRPATSGKVIWQGQVDPAANALAGDSWWPTA